MAITFKSIVLNSRDEDFEGQLRQFLIVKEQPDFLEKIMGSPVLIAAFKVDTKENVLIAIFLPATETIEEVFIFDFSCLRELAEEKMRTIAQECLSKKSAPEHSF